MLDAADHLKHPEYSLLSIEQSVRDFPSQLAIRSGEPPVRLVLATKACRRRVKYMTTRAGALQFGGVRFPISAWWRPIVGWRGDPFEQPKHPFGIPREHGGIWCHRRPMWPREYRLRRGEELGESLRAALLFETLAQEPKLTELIMPPRLLLVSLRFGFTERISPSRALV